jgi:hypothetical protein|tara:strand:- start:533 stop:1105 length:573 start_codon:yes stop_codon:yes gene_type:complete
MAIEVKTNHRQNSIEPDSAGVGGAGVEGSKGTRNNSSLLSIFSGSPLVGYSESEIEAPGEADKLDYSDPEKLRQWYISNVVKGTVTDASYGLGTYDLDFGNNTVDGAPSPPNLAEQALSDANVKHKPATGFVPNPSSPGEGSITADTKPDAPDAFVDKLSPNGSAFTGDNIVTRANLKDQAKSIVDRQGS